MGGSHVIRILVVLVFLGVCAPASTAANAVDTLSSAKGCFAFGAVGEQLYVLDACTGRVWIYQTQLSDSGQGAFRAVLYTQLLSLASKTTKEVFQQLQLSPLPLTLKPKPAE